MWESVPLISGVTVIYISFLFSCNDTVENIMEICHHKSIIIMRCWNKNSLDLNPIQTEHKNALLLLLLNYFFRWMIVGVCLCGGWVWNSPKYFESSKSWRWYTELIPVPVGHYLYSYYYQLLLACNNCPQKCEFSAGDRSAFSCSCHLLLHCSNDVIYNFLVYSSTYLRSCGDAWVFRQYM